MANIVAIPVKMEKYYGTGTMLHPSIEEVKEVVQKIPIGKLTTIGLLCEKLAKDFSADVTCPMRTGNHLKKMAIQSEKELADNSLPFWRVIRTDKMVIKHKESAYWASKLENEGFALSFTKAENIKVIFDKDQVYSF